VEKKKKKEKDKETPNSPHRPPLYLSSVVERFDCNLRNDRNKCIELIQ